ncbi:MAG: chemotaxis response regulator protein-glutamate methylesterase [Gammaproteobacteria bacterium]|nr:chemotaxis response regulator protein-glutamate methylesterase [Gammaproteobacteria bacterium]
MRVAVVNDSKLAAESLRRVIAESGRHHVAWVAEDGAEAVRRSTEDRPDLILMDLIMPNMDGVEATRQIMAKAPCAIVVVTASVAGNAAKVFEAMGAGALDAINTPILGMDGSGAGNAALLHKIDMVGRLIQAPKRSAPPVTPEPPNPCMVPGRCPPLIAIGASTGGPAALKTLLAPLPADLPAAIIVIQHVDKEFAHSFAEWLDEQTALSVRLAQPGDRPSPGHVLIAGREDHLIVTTDGRLDYTPEPADYAYRPSVNVFFESMARYWRGHSVGVLLTGMGRDGGTGLLSLRQAGAHTIAQDQASSAIYGMPKAAAELGAAVDILGLDAIGPALLKSLRRPLTA